MRFLPLFLLPVLVTAQQPPQEPPVIAPRSETVVVTGTLDPVPLEEADRNVSTFALTAPGRLLVATPFDLLRLDASVDVRGRAPNGVQSDVSVRGGTFGQTLVLLNGLRFNNAQSGHHNFDLPLPLELVDRMEVLKGSGSMFYGSDAVGGVVNVLTRHPQHSELRLRAAAGNFGANQQSGALSLAGQRWSEQLSFSRDFSTGFLPNRDFRNLSVASSTSLTSALGATGVLLAANDRPFGADQFYGNYPSWERTRGWFAGVRQNLGSRMEAAFGYRRHTDLFLLDRARPQAFTNRHADQSWQASLRRRDPLGATTGLHYGVEGFHDSIVSTNLGTHERSRGAVYVAADSRALRRFSFTAGLREEFYGSGETQLSPTVSAGVWLSSAWKLRASASRAFRLPSFTDLFYRDPANIGSPGLRPEKAWTFEAGAQWSPGRVFWLDAAVFERRERDGIDYVRESMTAVWRAANFQRLRFTGVEASAGWQPGPGHSVEARYTALRGAQDAVAGLFSKYVFNYPTQNGTFAYTGTLPGGIVARARLGAVKRYAREPYALWDASAAYSRGRVRPFAQAYNLGNAAYQEVFGVPMPGRSFVAGLELVIFSRQ